MPGVGLQDFEVPLSRTSSFALGEVVPIPTLPVDVILRRSAGLVPVINLILAATLVRGAIRRSPATPMALSPVAM